MFDIRRWFSSAPAAGGNATTRLCDNPGSVRLLAILPGAGDAEQLRGVVEQLDWSVSIAGTESQAMALLQGEPITAVICDQDLPDEDWRDVITRIAALPHAPCVLLASRVMDQYLWNEVIQCRGYDVVSKPFQREELRRVLSFALSFPERPSL